MTPYRDRMNQGHYGQPVASTTTKNLEGTTKAKAKPKTTRSKRA